MTSSAPDVSARELFLIPTQPFEARREPGAACIVVLEGRGVLRTTDGEASLGARTVIVLARSPAWHLAALEPLTAVHIQWSAEGLRRLGPLALGLSANLVLEGRSTPALAWQLRAELGRVDEFSKLAIELFARAIALSLSRYRSRRPVQERRVAREARDLIVRTPSGARSVADIAAELKVTPAYLSRAFRSAYHESPSAFARRVRVQRAETLLHSTDHPIGRVAHELGYADASHFARDFTRAKGLSPAAFRGQQQRSADGQVRTEDA